MLAFELLLALARDNLTLGLSVVVDNPIGYRFRDRAEQVARGTRAELKVIECICTDGNLLRERMERRGLQRSLFDARDVDAAPAEAEKTGRLTGPRVIVDTAEALPVNLRKVLAYLSGAAPVAG
jgi:predicted kinase